MSGRVPPSSRAHKRRHALRLRNPDSIRDELAAVGNLFESFTGHDPVEIGAVRLPKQPKALAVIGICDGIMYRTTRDGVDEKYLHKFKLSDAPLLCVTPDGTQIFLVGGAYDFTERGIVDRTSKR